MQRLAVMKNQTKADILKKMDIDTDNDDDTADEMERF